MEDERVATSPQMEQAVKQLALRCGATWSHKGTRLSVAMPDRTDRWLITNLSGQRISVTHCWVEEEDCLSPDLEMVFALHPEGWKPVELLHTDAVWETYVQAAQAAGISVYDEQGDTYFAHFTEYWAYQLQQEGWLEHSYKVEETKDGRIPGCQSTHVGPCYGELWQCATCDKTVCFAEGSDNHPELCDACWVKSYGGLEDDIPF
jgi:hypothetical protein